MKRFRLPFLVVALLWSQASAAQAQPPGGVTGCPGSETGNYCLGVGDERDLGLVTGGQVRMKVTRTGTVTFPASTSISAPRLAAAPPNPVEGQFYYDTVEHALFIYNGSTWSAIGAGSGSPGGSSGQLQYNNAGNFGGVPVSYASSTLTTSLTGFWLQNRPTNYTTENGAFGVFIGSASAGVGERRDDIGAIGWNIGNDVAGLGSVAWVFEAHCGPTPGCSSDGQSEMYLSVDDGEGNATRPIGVFQQHDGTGYTYGINRFDTQGWFDRAQSYQIFAVDDNSGTGELRTFTSTLNSNLNAGTFLTLAGVNAIGVTSGAIDVGKGTGVNLAPNGDGSGTVLVGNVHFRMVNPSIENTSGDTLIQLTTDATNGPYPRFSGANGDNLVYAQPAGGGSNVGWMIQPKGTGAVRLNSEDTSGTVYFQTGAGQLKVGPFPGKAGVTASGTVCTITEITNGIITAATCS